MKTQRRSARSLATALFGIAAALAFAPAFAQQGTPKKTTGSHIVRGEKSADDVRLEEVEVMLGTVRDAKERAREARDERSGAPELPARDGNAFLDDAAAQQPR
ncbi:MAG TPA: hypothetical protein VLF18_22415 [Tahibacter sp.]|uniref:hypothetical protein n=1 Tax=Tahibacter sp. TaxID=2056211 RepID=UPI002BD7C182|nr:hypothetical protein [Tahibacter sp.]HSX62949.1 hypothetical protein [Tahibacter sp.]